MLACMLNRSSIRVVEPPSRHDEGSGAPRESASAWHAHVALIVVAAGAFCFVTSETLPSGLLTLIAAGLGTSFSTTGQLVTAYAVVVVLFSLPMTFATARIPHRTLLTVTLGVFCASTLLAAVAPTFGILLVSRLFSGLSHARFWSVAAAAVTGLFPPEIRGRVVARLALGQSLGPVLGVPLGVWLGQQTDWRTPFFVLGGASLLLTVAVFLLFPSYPPAHGGAARGSNPSRLRFLLLLLSTGITVTGGMAVLTYIAPFILDYAGFADRSLSLVLGVSGVAGVLGTILVGRFLDAHPGRCHVVVLVGLVVAYSGLYGLGTWPAFVVAFIALNEASFGAMAGVLMHRGLQLAPGTTDIAVAAVSTAFNVGIAAGAFFGGRIIAASTVGDVPLLAALLMSVALGVVGAELGTKARAQPADARIDR